MSAKETVRDLCDPAYTPQSYRDSKPATPKARLNVFEYDENGDLLVTGYLIEPESSSDRSE